MINPLNGVVGPKNKWPFTHFMAPINWGWSDYYLQSRGPSSKVSSPKSGWSSSCKWRLIFPMVIVSFWVNQEHPSTDNHTISARWLSAPEPFTCPWSRLLNQKRPLKIHGFTRWPMRICQRSKLVGGWTNPSEKIFKSNWTSSPSKGENSNKKLKPPSSKDEFQLTKTSLENKNF